MAKEEIYAVYDWFCRLAKRDRPSGHNHRNFAGGVNADVVLLSIDRILERRKQAARERQAIAKGERERRRERSNREARRTKKEMQQVVREERASKGQGW